MATAIDDASGWPQQANLGSTAEAGASSRGNWTQRIPVLAEFTLGRAGSATRGLDPGTRSGRLATSKIN